LEIVKPDRLYLGQKDYQQCMVISQLIELIGVSKQTNVIICPTLRENDGLAMSSRNMRLNEEERKKAVEIYKTLQFIKANVGKKVPQELKKEAAAHLTNKGFKVDYVEIADASTLEPVNSWAEGQKMVCLIAAFNNEVRLIDNMLLNQA
jgi:pantoate--beta-alanine ligase